MRLAAPHWDRGPPARRQARRLRSQPTYAATLAWRELRGGAHGFGVFVACLILGVGAIAAIGSLQAVVETGIAAAAKSMLGGDVEARLPLRPATEAEHRYLAASGTLSETAKLRATARSQGGRHSLIELQAVDAAYPLYGSIALAPAGPLAAALAPQHGAFGAVAEAALAQRLALQPGSEFRIGNARLRLSAIIAGEPDAAFAGLAFGPRVIVSRAALAQTGLLQPGTLIDYRYRVRLPPREKAARWIERTRAAFPQAGWQLRGSGDASPFLRRLVERVGLFLNLAGVTALLVGGIGIGNAVAAHVAGKRADIATLKCLGGSTRLIFAAYLLQVAALAALGIAGGLLLGACTGAAAVPLLAGWFPVSLRVAVYPAPLAVAASCGLLTTLLFGLAPLAAIGRIAPAALWRDRVAPAPRRPPGPVAAASGAAAFALAAIVMLTAPDRQVALWYVGGIIAAFALFWVAGGLTIAAARRLPRPSRPLLRLALGNLHRADAPTKRIVLSLGIGLAAMIAAASVEGNLAIEIGSRLAERAPADFLIDIQPGQLDAVAALVRAAPGARFDQVAMLRGRIASLNGTPVEQAKVAPGAEWAVRGERGLTYSATLPAGSRVVAGEWWPADYRGAPLVLFDAELARGMNLKVGDTLTVNLLGREISARIANLRQIDWTRLGINFVLVFAPGTLEAAPHTHLAAVYAAPPAAERLVEEIAGRFPNVSAIPVSEALAQVARVVGAIGGAVQLVALVAIAAGLLVLGSAVAAEQRRRVYDAVMLKVLGATRRDLAVAFLVEHMLLGALTAAIACGVGTLAAWALVTGPMKSAWVFLPLPLLATAAAGVGITAALGFTGTWQALSARPARRLRQD